MKKYIGLLAAVVLTSSVFVACKKNDDDATTPTNTNKLRMHFHTSLGDNEIQLGVEGQDNTGRKYVIDRLQFYISDFTLVGHDDNVEYNNHILFDANQPSYVVGDIAVGHFNSFNFNAGVNPAVNHDDPSTYKTGNPLANQSPSMHWGWASGYKFIVLEGKVDADGNGVADKDFVIHVGTDDLLRNVSISNHFDTQANADYTLHMNIDVAELFTNVDLSGTLIAHMPNTLTETVADNMQNAVTLE